MTSESNQDAIIIGCGFAGIYSTYVLHNKLNYKTRTFEMSDQPGGVWNWNRYPGARVDHMSKEYCFKFDENLYNEWNWSEIYSPQPELKAYAEHLLRRYNLRPHIQFSSRLANAKWDEENSRWSAEFVVTKPDGTIEEQKWTGRHLILATGCLSAPNKPKFAGLEDYVAAGGKVYHTGEWPREGVDFTGQKVAIIGTGSSGVQSTPEIAAQASSLHVFQRTPVYTAPAYNRKVTDAERDEYRKRLHELVAATMQQPGGFAAHLDGITPPTMSADFNGNKEKIMQRFEDCWKSGGFAFYGSFIDLILSPDCAKLATEFYHNKIKSLVKDPKTAENLCPDYPPGCKRMCVDTNYYVTYNLPHVHLVAGLKERPLKVVGGKDKFIELEDGSKYGPFDAIVLATGFDAMTGTLAKINITGRNGITLKDAWAAGPVNYLGLFIHGFPNMYHLAGPGSPSVLTMMIHQIEQQVEWIEEALKKMDAKGLKTIEATEEAQNGWVGFSNMAASMTLLNSCNSWYLGANVPGKPRVFMPFVPGMVAYRQKCNEVLEKDFEGLITA
ncbi:cyclohexanone monooxygenase [Gonapodya prolifera JEL478]|uniref:Cyclohexanone monooxygenase n=1 Tax=Gonapodya prolifera (strain JEL478) TaxID=1344416 RepID=A0A139AEK9_GONPJ|nr:cyclohexanone monooxygenase [Gonapodya prolifera JEL478]|eukprot:KXS14875.1 cyclohexanone monooxygenase [Gonapodya prolifera JEL478]